MRGLVLGCCVVLLGCRQKVEVRPAPEPSVTVRDAEPAVPHVSVDTGGFRVGGKTVPFDQREAVLRDLAKRWPNDHELRLSIASEVRWGVIVQLLDAARASGFSVWSFENEGHVARIEAPRAEQAFPAKGEDADACAFSITRVDVTATDYSLNGVRFTDLDTLDAKLEAAPCPSSRVIVIADRELSSARVIRVFEQVVRRNRKVGIGVTAVAP